MPERQFECSLCNVPMKCIRTQKTTPKRSYRIRTFQCDICGNTETIYADGGRDRPREDKFIRLDELPEFKEQDNRTD